MPTRPQLTKQRTAEERTRRQVLGVLVFGVIAISIMSLIANILWMNQVQYASKAMLFFDVDQEKSLATWWASATLAALGVLTWFVGQSRPQHFVRRAARLVDVGVRVPVSLGRRELHAARTHRR